MQHAAITFETHATPATVDPARMDVACFVGLAAQRADSVVPEDLADGLAQAFSQRHDELMAPDGLINRPVSVTSADTFESLFETTRPERQAVVEGGALVEPLGAGALTDGLSVVVDGVVHMIELVPLPSTVAEVADIIGRAGLGLEVSVPQSGGNPILRLALPLSHGTGTLAVLPCPALGFHVVRRAEARMVPTPLAMALRGFFAMGGRKAHVVAMGRPPPYDTARELRMGALHTMMVRPESGGDPVIRCGAGDLVAALDGPLPTATEEPGRHHGLTHLFGLPGTTFFLFPDLPELVAAPAGFAPDQAAPQAPGEIFSECLPTAVLPADSAESRYLAPVLDAQGGAMWRAAVNRVLRLLRQSARDTLLVASLPRSNTDSAPADVPASAFLQLAEGWVRMPHASSAAQGLMAPDAVLAGHLARMALLRGTHVSAASLPLAPVSDIEERPHRIGAPTCALRMGRDGLWLSGDLTTSDDPAWKDGPVSRIMALLLRQARRMGRDLVFEPNDEALHARVRDGLAGLLEAMRRAGALAGEGQGDSFDVRCDRSTMSARDLETGHLVAEVWFRPSAPVSAITVRLPLTEGRKSAAFQGGPN